MDGHNGQPLQAPQNASAARKAHRSMENMSVKIRSVHYMGMQIRTIRTFTRS